MADCLSIFLDESGDLGFDFTKKGTPRFFIIALLVFEEKIAIEQFKNAVKRTIKNKLNKKNYYDRELKGTATTFSVKQYFFRHIGQIPGWSLYGIILDKYKLKNKLNILPNENRIYNYLSKEVLSLIDFSKVTSQLLLCVDKRKGKKGINEFNKYLSNHLEAMLPFNVMYDISHALSHENLALQAIDLFCWGIRRYYEHGDDEWLSIYEERLTYIEVTDFLNIKKDGP